MNLEQLLEIQKPPQKQHLHITYQDFVRFFWKFKGLELEKVRNQAFWTSTNENLKIAYEKLDENERALARAYDLNRKYLDNIKEGLCLIDKSCIILGQYSRFLCELFGTEDIANRNFIDFIYPHHEAQSEERRELEKFLSILFNNTTADLEMIMDINPLNNRRLMLVTEEDVRKEIIINARFNRIYKNDEIEQIMIIFEDRTHFFRMQEKLENEKNKHQAEIEIISSLLNAGPRVFLDFITETCEVLKDFQEKLDDLGTHEGIDNLFRQMHSLKASAAYFQLHYLAGIAHQIENILQRFKNGEKITDCLVEQVKELHTRFIEEIHHIEEMNEKLIKFSGAAEQTKSLSKKILMDNFKKFLREMSEEMCKELNKNVNLDVSCKINGFPFLKELKTPIIHLVRNAIDHGIEDNYLRLSRQKEAAGKVIVEFSRKEGVFIVQITDDGGGIDFKEVHKKALKKGLMKHDTEPTNAALLNVLFSPNFSIREKITQYSGRGYGLDIVKDVVNNLKGKICVKTDAGKGTTVSLRIPVPKQNIVCPSST